MSTFIQKYQPTTISQIVGNKKIIPDIFNWINSPTTKLCLIDGPTGIGKSLCIKLICNELNIQSYYVDNLYENVDMNILKSLNRINPMTNKKNYIIIEEIDTISNLILDEIVKDINNIHVPIICISNTNYIPSMKPILDKITNFKMFSPYENEILTFLYPILRENKILLKNNELNDIINNCNRDIRYILNTIEMMKYDKNKINNNKINFKDHTSLNMFEISKGLFDMDNTFDKKYNLFFLDYSIMPLFIQENYINNTFNVKDIVKKMENISYSAELLANGDLFESMINETNDWDLQKYIAVCNIEATSEKCNTKIIKFPEYFKKNKKQFSSYENSLKNINYYYPIDTQINKLSIEKKQKITFKKESEQNKKINIRKKINESENNESIVLNKLPKKIKKNKNDERLQQQTIQPSDCEEIILDDFTIEESNQKDKQENLEKTEKTEKTEKIKKIKNKIILKQIEIEEDKQINENIITCECGITIKKSSKSSHLKSKKHSELLEKIKNKK